MPSLRFKFFYSKTTLSKAKYLGVFGHGKILFFHNISVGDTVEIVNLNDRIGEINQIELLRSNNSNIS